MDKKRYMTLDILKGIAMIMVILVHYNQSFSNNIRLFSYCQMGCQIFFVMSGLGVAFSLSSRFNHNRFVSQLIPFYKSRLLRIAPAYYFMMIVVFFINTVLLVLTERTLSFGSNRSLIGIICNLLFIHGLVPTANNNVMPGGWYIGTTMLLYLIAPFFFFLLQKFPKRKRTICALISVISIGTLFILSLLVPEQYKRFLTNNNSFGYFSILTQLPCFALGMLLYFEIEEEKLGNPVANILTGIVILVLSVVLFFNPLFDFSYIFTVSIVGLATFFLSKGLICIEQKKDINCPFKFIITIGKKSLYVFLTHAFFTWPFVSVIKKLISLLGCSSDNYVVYFVLFPVVVVLSFFSGVLLEKVVAAIMRHLTKNMTAKTI